MSSFVSLILFIWIGAVTPGPVNLLTMSCSISYGWRRTLPFVLGASIAYALVVLLMSTFLRELFEANQQLKSLMAWICGAYLLYIAYRIANSVVRFSSAQNTGYKPSFVAGALMQLLNPKAWLFASSSLGLFIAGQHHITVPILSLFCALALIICFIGVGSWLLAGHYLKKSLIGSSQIRMVNLGLALLLCIAVIPITFSQI